MSEVTIREGYVYIMALDLPALSATDPKASNTLTYTNIKDWVEIEATKVEHDLTKQLNNITVPTTGINDATNWIIDLKRVLENITVTGFIVKDSGAPSSTARLRKFSRSGPVPTTSSLMSGILSRTFFIAARIISTPCPM